jgi:hypothetical protein
MEPIGSDDVPIQKCVHLSVVYIIYDGCKGTRCYLNSVLSSNYSLTLRLHVTCFFSSKVGDPLVRSKSSGLRGKGFGQI